MISTLNRYYHTLKYLRPIQWYGQLKFRFYKTKIKNFHPLALRGKKYQLTQPIDKNVSLDDNGTLTLLNQTANINDPILWKNPQANKLWLYNLQYFDYLPLIKNDLVNKWITHNKIGAINAWESYPISLRLVNWIKYLKDPASHILESLCLQARYLNTRLEIHLLANHLFANAKALIFAGCYFSGREADKWYRKGFNILNHEINQQILNDGGHFELSPMYHCIILEDLLDIINIHQAYDKAFPKEWLKSVAKMFAWLTTMNHPDNQISFFNDSAFQIAPTLKALSDYAERLKLNITQQKSNALSASGYYRLENDNAVLIADAGRVGPAYQPGHAHADTLSFELSINGVRCFVNSGTSTYEDNAERKWQRSTRAHNTVTINECNSSNVWKSFRVAERAKTFDVNFTENKLSATHDGYYKKHKIKHSRCWELYAKQLLITDKIQGWARCKVQIPFYLHPEIKVQTDDDVVYLTHPVMGNVKVCIDEPFAIHESWYYPEFNKKVANKVILIERTVSLPFTNTVTVSWE